MGPVVVVGDEIFEELVGEVIEVLEGCAFDDVVIEGSPKALDLAVGLRPVRSCVALFDAELEQHGLERMVLRGVAEGELGAVVGQDFGKHQPVGDPARR